MATHNLLPIYDRFLDYLVKKATPDEILAFEATPEEQDFVQELLERQSEGTITPEEESLLRQMRDFERMASVLKTKALKLQKSV